VLLALTTNQKLGLATMAAIFIAFSLICALLIPRYRPDFPGRKGVGLFVVLALLLMVGMLGAVVVFANEEHAEAAEHGEATTTAESGGAPPPSPPPPATTQEAAPAGDPAAGKALFASNGCAGCHTFAAAGATGTVGPNLDEVLKDKDAAFVHESIKDPNAEIAPGYQAGIMPSFAQLSDKQVDDLVAFLKQG
jgi:mono/diheme cytochrome c family protein